MTTTLSCEAFLNMCDDLYIVEEGFKSIDRKYSQITNKIDTTKKNIEASKDLNQRITLYKELKSEVLEIQKSLSNDKSIQLKDIGFIIKQVIMPAILSGVFIGGGSMIKKEDPKSSKLAIGAGAIIGGLGALIGVDDYKQKINRMKDKYNKAINESIKEIDKIIQVYNEMISKGIKDIDQFNKYNEKAKEWKKNQEIAVKKLKEELHKFLSSIKPVNSDPNKNSINQMKTESISFLKKVIAMPLFKAAFKDYMHLIHLEITNYASDSLFEVSITEYQSGWGDSPNNDPYHDEYYNEWYYILLDVGEKFIRKRFAPWEDKVWHSIDTGDGDEGAIYVG